jgi:hypothetical protein
MYFIISIGPDVRIKWLQMNHKRSEMNILKLLRFLNADSKPASLDDVIKACENLHVD